METKFEYLYYLISRLTIMLEFSRECGIGVMIEKQINGTEEKPEIDPQIYSYFIFKQGRFSVISLEKRKLF